MLATFSEAIETIFKELLRVERERRAHPEIVGDTEGYVTGIRYVLDIIHPAWIQDLRVFESHLWTCTYCKHTARDIAWYAATDHEFTLDQGTTEIEMVKMKHANTLVCPHCRAISEEYIHFFTPTGDISCLK